MTLPQIKCKGLVFAFLFHIHILKCQAAIRVISPKGFVPDNGTLTHSMALFGRPDYGGQLTGTLYLAPKSNRNGCKPFNKTEMPLWNSDGAHNFIMMIERGSCHFVEKVRNAQEVSARGVVIYDDTASYFLPVMADDGTGGDVHIPSVLIRRSDGMNLIQAMNSDETVVVSLSWQVPHPDNRVEWELWFSSRDMKTHSFIKNFKTVFEALGTHAKFTPRYEVFDGDSWGCTTSTSHCKNLCIQEGKYCAYDPESDPDIGLDGVDVVQEDIRQLCIWSLVGENQSQNSAIKWWEYVAKFDDVCSVKNATSANFSQGCSEQVQKSIGIDVAAVQKCVAENASALLEAEVGNKTKYGIISTPRIVVNELQHYGDISCPHPIDLGLCSPLRMICSGFLDGTQPEACESVFWTKQCYPPNEIDACGTCGSRNSSSWNAKCKGCDGVANSGKVKDDCGVCGGTGSFDACGKCLQKDDPNRDKTCLDCKGIVNGDAKLDACGVCEGHGSFDACGICLDQFDPKRQNYECKVEDDPDAVRIKLILPSVSVKSFSHDNANEFKKAIAAVCHVSDSNVIVKSVTDTGKGGCAVFAFVFAKDGEERDKIITLLASKDVPLEIAVRMRSSTSLSTEVKIDSITTGDVGVADNSNKARSTGTIVISLIIVLCILGSTGYYIMWRREQKIRRDIHDMFAKYTPLVAMEEDESQDPLV